MLPSSRATKYLSLPIEETQKGNNWCLAYATAIIMRYKGVYKKAETVMKEIHGNNVSTETGMGNDNVVPYARTYGINSVVFAPNNSYSTFVQRFSPEMNANRPVILGMVGNIGGHAVVGRGYDNVKGSYSIWNPWYNFYETVTTLMNYTPALHRDVNYSLDGYYYNWQ